MCTADLKLVFTNLDQCKNEESYTSATVSALIHAGAHACPLNILEAAA